MKAAKGQYWTGVDADDEVADGGLQAMLAAAERNGYPDIVYGSILNCWCDGTIAKEIYPDMTLKGSDTAAHIIHTIGYSEYVTVWGKIINREFSINSGIWMKPEMHNGEDADYMWRLMPKMTSATILSKIVYRYQQYNSRATLSISSLNNIPELYKTISENLPKILSGQQLKDYRKAINNKFALIYYSKIKMLYSRNFGGKSQVLKNIRQSIKEIDLKPQQYYKNGLPHLLWQTLKISPFAANMLFSTIRISPLRKRVFGNN